MERRLAVHARRNPQALIGAGARKRVSLLLLGAMVSTASPAFATPKRKAARAAFDRGIAAYKASNYAAASTALGRSFDLERDVDTLFAWAQSERKLDHCDKAVELYQKILTFDLAPANREAVNAKIGECKEQIVAKPAEPPPVVTPAPAPVLAPPPTPAPEVAPAPPPPPPVHTVGPWYKDPIALALLGVGVAGAGVGTALLVSASSLDSDSKTAFDSNRYDDAQRLADQAKSRGTLGLITVSAGGAVLAGGLVWIALRHRGAEQPQSTATAMTGWLSPGGGGLAVVGGF